MDILPYDLYAAADLFLGTGRSETEILPRLGLTPERWRALASAYFHLLMDDRHLPEVQALWSAHDPRRLLAALVGPRWVMPPGETSPSATVRGIRRAVLAAPHLGPFADAPWRAVHVLNDPVAWLRYYSHDGERVYFWACRSPTGAGPRSNSTRPHFATWADAGTPTAGASSARASWAGRASGGTGGRWRARTSAASGRSTCATPATRSVRGTSPARPSARAALRRSRSFPTCASTGSRARPSRSSTGASSRGTASAVYSYGAAVREADPTRFRALGQGYWTDDRGVWVDDGKTPVVAADATSFLVPGPNDPRIGRGDAGDATDRHRPYLSGRPVPPAAAFEDWSAFFLAREDAATGWWGRMRDGTRRPEGSST